jgi:hypothetical protein
MYITSHNRVRKYKKTRQHLSIVSGKSVYFYCLVYFEPNTTHNETLQATYRVNEC